ncbi:BZ3500_MvSof-1268-A1-R1_Chr5-3g08146 [Microbotryum saponariae]|uniref:BZ3500_MvSof-1268-A1-R1_Chr5-3g08146 protein n=1 Tax=Microbotryum saponariae TaxID=289078 RepID=A0A2X0MF26_9BASI|nr:BZ3500_MvSof-1268-A1-R1_Chr5-3g08146 [Microbotryum saponariae]SDA07905.1 BZ3501_MvSof-1269-A2-R1_Chr5-1g07290 [Microbotryum saponariae]
MRARSRLDKVLRRGSAVPQSAAAPHHNTLYTASPSEAIELHPAILPDCVHIAQLFSSPDEPNKDSEPLT